MAIQPKKRPRNRQAQEATLINLTALKRRVKVLEVLVEAHDKLLRGLTTAEPPFGEGER